LLGHHIVSVRTYTGVFIALLFLTIITVLAAQVDLGVLNFPLAMLIATVKASFVVFIFMGLKYDSLENRTIFFSSFIFLAIFIILTLSDVMFRSEDVYVNKSNSITKSVD
jgi:cytochrome c oxidase subunit IV